MDVNQLSNEGNYGNSISSVTRPTKVAEVTQVNKATEVTRKNELTSAVYEKNSYSTSGKQIYKPDRATVDRMIEEAEKRSENLRGLVEKLLLKQGEKVNGATDIYQLLREGKVKVDPATQAQAQKDIAEDGYWGVKETAERMVSFAKALTGGDPSKADDMIEAVKKGFDQATKAWGGELPEISKKTVESAVKQLEEWRESI